MPFQTIFGRNFFGGWWDDGSEGGDEGDGGGQRRRKRCHHDGTKNEQQQGKIELLSQWTLEGLDEQKVKNCSKPLLLKINEFAHIYFFV